ncbi:MAG: 3' terminal RNA ribose 2'-O-methyltransferase Hen1 [Phycisphaeraceae bacterium]
MLLSITSTTLPATDLGYLLHKHPDRVQTFDLAFGRAHVLYQEVSDERCTAALVLDVDPVGMVRQHRGPAGDGQRMEQYVNDRPYVASSLMSVAIARVLGSALGARCPNRPELVERPLQLKAKLAVLPARRGGEELVRRLFEPLGYDVAIERHALDEHFTEWGGGPYVTLTLRATRPLHELLNHLYVLIPVLDNDKHYWVGQDEVEKLLKRGEGWLPKHPERELITARYLRYFGSLTRDGLARLSEADEPDPDAAAESHAQEEEAIEQPMSLNEQRHAAVIGALKGAGVRRVLDLGCAQGTLLRRLLDEPQFEQVVGVDVSLRALEVAEDRLKLSRLPELKRQRIQLMHGSLIYRDARLAGFDAACLVEVIEHFDASRLAALERSVFAFARPGLVIVTTPNVEYNVRFENLPAGTLRHRDHRFEWTRRQFRQWAERVAERFGYSVRFLPVGPVDEEVGAPTQMGVFER